MSIKIIDISKLTENERKVNDYIIHQNDIDNEAGNLYNCMGYALNIKQWLRPLDVYGMWDFEGVERESYINDILFEYEGDENAAREAFTKEEIEALINVWGLRIATKEEIQNENTVLIAFREMMEFALDADGELCCCDADFHFRKRINGIWTEKMGTSEIRCCYNENEAVWDGGYDGDIYYFVKVA